MCPHAFVVPPKGSGHHGAHNVLKRQPQERPACIGLGLMRAGLESHVRLSTPNKSKQLQMTIKKTMTLEKLLLGCSGQMLVLVGHTRTKGLISGFGFSSGNGTQKRQISITGRETVHQTETEESTCTETRTRTKARRTKTQTKTQTRTHAQTSGTSMLQPESRFVCETLTDAGGRIVRIQNHIGCIFTAIVVLVATDDDDHDQATERRDGHMQEDDDYPDLWLVMRSTSQRNSCSTNIWRRTMSFVLLCRLKRPQN